MASQDPFRREVLRVLQSRVDSMGGAVDPVTREISRVMLSRGVGASEDDGRNFFARALDALTPQSVEEVGVIGAGLLAPTLEAGQGLFQIPGLLTSRYLPTDRAADFLGRLSQGVTSRAETAALNAGASPELISDSHLLGEIFGYALPVVASLKAARLVTGIRGPVLTLSRNFVLDSTAGAIFGATMRPGDDLTQRAVNSLRESALFGVGGLMVNGLIFAATGFRYNRARMIGADQELDQTLLRVSNGEQVVLGEAGVPLTRLLSEEGFLASSPEAYSMLSRFEVEEALVQGVRSLAESGSSRGFVRSIGEDFAHVSRVVERLRQQGPAYKYDIVKGEVGYDVHFGLSGLSNSQRAQLAREGRFAGQVLEKAGTTYSYVRPGKGGKIVVRTADGKVTSIDPTGITDLPYASEQVPISTIGQAMYADYRNYTFSKISEAAGVEGGMTEVAIVRGLRDGTIDLREKNLRLFESPGAITHPSEVGINPAIGSKYTINPVPRSEGSIVFEILDAAGENVASVNGRIIGTDFLIEGMFAAEGRGALGPGGVRDISRQIAKYFQSQGVRPERILAQRAGGSDPGRILDMSVDKLLRGDPSPEGFVRNFMERGTQTGALLEPAPVRRMDDAFDAWLRDRGLNPSAEDIEAFRAHFDQRIRDDLWALVPEEDMKIFQAIRDETNALIDERGLTLRAYAHTKGFHTNIDTATGQVTLRDINTGARLEFGSAAFARQALEKVVRAEKDPFFNFVTPGNHGMPGLTGGFDPADNVWTFGDNIASSEFLAALPFEGITNRRDYLRKIEDVSGIPIFSRGFAEIDTGLLKMREKLEPIGRRIAAAWKGLDRAERIQVAEFWTGLEGSRISGTELIRAARTAGLSSRQIQAFVQSRSLFDYGAQLLGLPESRFIPNYYSRVRPRMEAGERYNLSWFRDDPIALKEFEFWAEMPRTGDMATIELDPELVLHKYFRSLFYKQDISPIEQRIRTLVDARIRDLPQVQQTAIMKRALPNTTGDSYVLPDPVRSVLTEYLNNVRGDGAPGFGTMRRFTTRIFKLLGMETDPRLFDELHSTYLSMQYGAAIGLRPMLANRNAVQNLWMMYSRVGGKYGTESLRRAMAQEGYDQAVRAGAVRPTETTVPMGDAIFETWISDPNIMKGFNPLSQAFAAAMRKGIRLGQVTRRTAQKFMVPYGSSDQVNRAWAFHWQRLHTDDVLSRFNKGSISWDQFLEDGLPFFSRAVKAEFRTQFDKFGREAALDWIGKQAADEAHFIYGSASTPTWMQTPFGRLLGVFGQWPLWAWEMYGRRMAHGTPKQIASFWARTLALTGAFANMTVQSGINMWSWVAPASFEYAGGPFTDVLVQARALTEGSLDQKATALGNLINEVGSLSVPGQIFYQDISEVLDQNDPGHAAMLLMLGRPVDRGNFAYDWIYNPNLPVPREESPGLNLQGLPLLDLSSSSAGGRRSVSLSSQVSRPSL